MRYTRARIESIGYELAPVVVTSAELEERLAPMYEKLRIPPGQIEQMTGIVERRWWEPDFPISKGAVNAAKRALAQSDVRPQDLDTLIYAGVCRENFEPATACAVAADVGVSPRAAIYDLSNACLGVLNGIVDLANRIELGQIRAGMVVACETSREINDIAIRRLLERPDMVAFREHVTTLTGGSGAAAVIVTDGTVGVKDGGRRLVGGVTEAAPEFHQLCRWGIERLPAAVTQFMSTDSVGVLKYGVELGMRTWCSFLDRVDWAREQVDRVICHQVGSGHREMILRALGIGPDRDYATYGHLGNMGTVSLPMTAALAEERGVLKSGQRVGMLGIGSGLNCMMLGVEW